MADQSEILKDDHILEWGKEHKGKALANVPAAYLIWMFDKANGVPLKYRRYIAANRDVLEKEVREDQKRSYQRTKL